MTLDELRHLVRDIDPDQETAAGRLAADTVSDAFTEWDCDDVSGLVGMLAVRLAVSGNLASLAHIVSGTSAMLADICEHNIIPVKIPDDASGAEC